MTRKLGHRFHLTLSALCALAVAACSGNAPFVQSPAESSGAATVRHAGLGYRVLHSFGRGSDGDMPLAPLINDAGTLYGTTEYGGQGGNGTIFSIDSKHKEKVVYSFGARSNDGAGPVAGLLDVSGTLYGTTEFGGANGDGTVFSFVPGKPGKESVLYSFGGSNDGTHPEAGLIIYNGVMYGTTSAGGAYPALGTVYSVTTTGSETPLHSFGVGSDGSTPVAPLIEFKNEFYGTTSKGGGPSAYGTVFEISPSGTEKVLVSFACPNGGTPVAGLTRLSGALYGTTKIMGGGLSCTAGGGYGTVFSLSSAHLLRTVYSFSASPDGNYPLAGLIGVRGTLYGTTSAGGGSYNGGTIFNVTPAGKETPIRSFSGGIDGNAPAAALLHTGGAYYGTTSGGGRYGGGTVYELTL